ncbi:MAG: PilC/PilY family type IV pilus protein, partial [Gammaproteobacteria bacterium]
MNQNMNSIKTRAGSLLAAFVLGLGAASPAAADDAELFIASADPLVTGAQPNILFVIDTSGSMTTNVLTQEDWDPALTFNGCYRNDQIYWSTTNELPGCGSNNYFPKSRNFCQAASNQMDGIGSFTGKLAAWRPRNNARNSRWVELGGNRNRDVECEADRGIHGNGGSEKWAAVGTQGPWHSDVSAEPAWNNKYFLWDGNWLDWSASGGSITRTRIEIVQQVAKNLLDNVDGVNVGLMRFNFEQGGPVIHAMEDVATARPVMKATIDALPADGWTPLSETMYEAGQYFTGRNVDYGNVGPVMSVPASRLGGGAGGVTYSKPINYACQKNYIVLLTDGAPTRDVDAQSKIEGLPNFSSLVGPTCDGSGNGACLDDMAEYLYKADLDGSLPGVQNVTTYTIGFAVDLPLLKSTAERGGGEYKLADNTSTLANVLSEIILSIKDDATTFTAPSVPVNAFNRTQNLNDVFVSVFQPSATVHWPGNLKKYRLINGELVGQDDLPAVDPLSGFFADDAFSFWSPAADGDRAAQGGAASQQPEPDSRNVYTDLNGNTLTSTANRVEVGNNNIDANDLGTTAIERDSVIAWINGLDVFDSDDDGSTTDARRQMGDPFHVRPVTVIYGGTVDNPDAVVFVSTNDGQMHAIDAETGAELWTYIPDEMLDRSYEIYLDEPAPSRRYGLDGEIRAHVYNDDGIPGISGAERVFLTFGMRRGGDTVYTIEVTNRYAPKLLWKVDSDTAGFGELGQTWSTPVVTDVVVGGARKTVAIFGGGYDDGQDNPGYRTDTVGNAIYMVDLLTGNLLWKASNAGANLDLPEMTHSIPSPLAVVDISQNGLADRMYVGDMGGRLWRFDIVNGAAADDLVEGGVIASLGGAAEFTPTPADLRRFYAQPDVVPVISNDRLILTVNIGSGYRAHPLDATIEDEFFSVRDYKVFDIIPTDGYGPPITRTDLVDITTEPSPTLDPDVPGWRLRMVQSTGEKVLSQSFTFQGAIFFSSFSPGNAANSCV